MSYSIEEFKPSNPVLIIDGKEITLSLITLHKEVIFKNKYGSLSKVFEKISEKPEEILNVIWELVLDKNQFKNSLEVFKSTILSITSKEPIADKSQKMSACLSEAARKSMPLIKNKKRYQELQQIKGTQDEGKPCYAAYFDTVAKRYGYTLEKFYELTLGQLHILLNVIGDKSYEELEVQAALQGKKLKPRMKFEDISEEQEANQEEQALEALKRLQEEYKKKQAKKE